MSDLSGTGQRVIVGVICLSTNIWLGFPVVLFVAIWLYSALLNLVSGKSVASDPMVSLTNASSTSIGAVAFVESILYSPSSLTSATVFSVIVHWFNPLFAHSASIRFNDLVAVLRSYPVLNSMPHLSNASSIYSATSGSKFLELLVAI